MRKTSGAPALFIGHGSPMTAIEDNDFSRAWREIASRFPKPAAVLCASAHWYTGGTRINTESAPRQIHDFYGFPDALYEVRYPALGSPELAAAVQAQPDVSARADNDWGIDHGAWSVLLHMYPQADVPVVQLSIDRGLRPQEAFDLGRALGELREQGVLLLGSGNVVHNLRRIDWGSPGGFPWADEFDGYIREHVLAGQYDDVIHFERAGDIAALAFPTPEHFLPLLYVLGAARADDAVEVFNDARTLGSLSMTGYLFR